MFCRQCLQHATAQGCFYIDSFANVLESISNEVREIYILGDINCHIIAKSFSKTTEDLRSIILNVHLDQLVHKATHITLHL